MTVPNSPESETILEINNLKTYFYLEAGTVRAVDGVNLTLQRQQTLGLVGESGCGKSITAMSVMRLIQSPPGKIVDGQIILYTKEGEGVDIAALNPKGTTMRKIRGAEIAMVFQEPMTSLNPLQRVGAQIAESVLLHQNVGQKEALDRALEMLTKVQISAPKQRLDEYPHQMSGGMRQRVMIALALSCNPSILIADEPTTALDVTVQAQILDLMRQLVDHPDHAQPGGRLTTRRPCGRHVPGQGGRIRRGARVVPPSPASLHGGAAELRAGFRQEERAGSGADCGHGAVTHVGNPGVRLRGALPAGDADLPRAAAGAA
jgi:ABC-type dipeptide/oligopeptide/nickel transport system ATPase subunit